MQQKSKSISESHHNGFSYNLQQQDEDAGLFSTIQKMIFYLKQQQLSPVLLPFKQKIFQILQQKTKQQEKKLKTFKQQSDDEQQDYNKKNYKSIIYYMEIEKISFILKHYLRIRLAKIQKCAFYYFKNIAEAQSVMSKPEVEFVKKYVPLRYNFYEKNILKHLASQFRGFGNINIYLNKKQQVRLVNSNQSISDVLQPSVNEYVFAKLIRNRKQFRYDLDMEIKTMESSESKIASPNDILFLPYSKVKFLSENSERQEDIILI